MTNSIHLNWAEFKYHINTNFLPFRWIEKTNTYELFVSDSSLIGTCLIVKDGGSEQTEFEASYKSKGNKEHPSYSTYFNIRQTAATGANSTVFSMRNASGSGKTLIIEYISLNMSFDTATPLARSLLRYYVSGFSNATPTGGTSVNVAPNYSSNPTSVVTDIRYLDTGLTTTGVSFGNPVMNIGCPAVDGTTSSFTYNGPKFYIPPGEGICVRLSVAAVAGQGLTGTIVWREV